MLYFSTMFSLSLGADYLLFKVFLLHIFFFLSFYVKKIINHLHDCCEQNLKTSKLYLSFWHHIQIFFHSNFHWLVRWLLKKFQGKRRSFELFFAFGNSRSATSRLRSCLQGGPIPLERLNIFVIKLAQK